MVHYIKHRLPEIALTFIAFGVCMLLFTFDADDYGAFSYFNLPGGQFSNYPHVEYYYNGIVGISSVYKLLYPLYPGINWVGLSFLGFQVLSLYCLLRSIKNTVLGHSTGPYVTLGLQLLFTFFFVEDIINISHTRFSLLFCGLALFNLAFSASITRTGFVLNWLMFTLGILIRPESGLGMVLLVSVGYLIYNFSLAHLAKRIFFPVLLTVSLFSFFAYDMAHTNMYVKKVEPEIEYKIMDKRMVPLAAMKTAVDSVKYEAARAGMWFDITTMSPEYLRSLLLPGIDLSTEHAGKVFYHVLSFYKHYVFIPCYIVMLMAAGLLTPGRRKVVLKVALFSVAAFGVVYIADYNGLLVGQRHFLNMQLIMLLIGTYYLLEQGSKAQRPGKLLPVAAVVVIAAGTLPFLIDCKQQNEHKAADVACYEAAMAEIESTYSNRLVVATLSNVYLLNRSFSIYTHNYTRNNYIIFDLFTYSLAPHYLHFLSSRCGCDPTNPVEFFKWLSDNHALYMGEPDRYDLTQRYMKLVHGQQLKFTPLTHLSKPPCIEATEMSAFEFREISVED